MDSRFQLTFDDTNVYDYGDYYYEGMEQPAKGKMYNISIVGTLTESMNNYMCLMDIGALRRLYRENKDWMWGFDESSYQRVSVKCENMEDVQAVFPMAVEHRLILSANLITHGGKKYRAASSFSSGIL